MGNNMISSELINALFGGFAKFVSKLTHKDVEFEAIAQYEVMPVVSHKIVKFFEDATEALGNPSISLLGELEPGKTYCVQVNEDANWEGLECIYTFLAEKGIDLVIVNKDINFVEIPEEKNSL